MIDHFDINSFLRNDRKSLMKALKIFFITVNDFSHESRDVAANKFEGLDGPIDMQHLLISTLLPPAVKMFLEGCEREVVWHLR